jgi:hypothetical protein
MHGKPSADEMSRSLAAAKAYLEKCFAKKKGMTPQ